PRSGQQPSSATPPAAAASRCTRSCTGTGAERPASASDAFAPLDWSSTRCDSRRPCRKPICSSVACDSSTPSSSWSSACRAPRKCGSKSSPASRTQSASGSNPRLSSTRWRDTGGFSRLAFDELIDVELLVLLDELFALVPEQAHGGVDHHGVELAPGILRELGEDDVERQRLAVRPIARHRLDRVR